MRAHCSTSSARTSSACCRRARRPSASTPGHERLFAPSSPIAPRRDSSGSRRSSRAISSGPTPWTRPALSHATRTSVEVVRSAYATALQGFALPVRRCRRRRLAQHAVRRHPECRRLSRRAALSRQRSSNRERRRRRGLPRTPAVLREGSSTASLAAWRPRARRAWCHPRF